MPSPSRAPYALAAMLTLAVTLALPAAAAEPQCPLDLATCLGQFQAMRERPWMGIETDPDSLGRIVVHRVEPGSPAQRAGIRAGDVLETIGGKPPREWFAGKAGWIDGDSGPVAVLRGRKQTTLSMPYERIPEPVLARIIGVHMLEGHLAYMNASHSDEH